MKMLSIIKTIWGPSQDWETCPLNPLTVRRKVDGRWEYKPASAEDVDEHVKSDAW